MTEERNFPSPTKDMKDLVKQFLKQEISIFEFFSHFEADERDILCMLDCIPTHTTPRKFFVFIYQLYSKYK